MPKNVFAFDLDGTLFETGNVAVYSLQKTLEKLKREKLYQGSIPDSETIFSCMGLINEEIWAKLLPQSSSKIIKLANQELEAIELAVLQEGMGNLYSGVKKGLEQLLAINCDLIIVSNGGEAYVKGVVEYFDLAPLITDIFSAGEYKTKSKVDLLAIAKKKHPHLFMMIGDRKSDIEAGLASKVLTCGCLYGYGDYKELEKAHYLANDFSEVVDFIKKCLE